VIEIDTSAVADRLSAIRTGFEMGLKIRAADLHELLGIAARTEDEETEETLVHPSFQSSLSGLTSQEAFREFYSKIQPNIANGNGKVSDESKAEEFERYQLPFGLPEHAPSGTQ